MNRIGLRFAVFLMAYGISFVFAQKKTVPLNRNDWPAFNGNPYFSHSGKYVAFKYSEKDKSKILVRSIAGDFEEHLESRGDMFFTRDEGKFIYGMPGDTLAIYSMKTRKRTFLGGVRRFDVVYAGNKDYLCYSTGDQIKVKNLADLKDFFSLQGEDYSLNEQGNAVVAIGKTTVFLDLSIREQQVLSDSGKVSNIKFDASGKRLAFIAGEGQIRKLIYFDGRSSRLLTQGTPIPKRPDLLITAGDLKFSKDGSKLFFDVSREAATFQKDGNYTTDKLTIWKYNDAFVPISQDVAHLRSEYYKLKAVISTVQNNGKAILLEDENKMLVEGSNFNNGKYEILRSRIRLDDFNWREDQRPVFDMVSLDDGSLKKIVPASHMVQKASLSPEGRFFTWTNLRDTTIYCYEIKTSNLFKLNTGSGRCLSGSGKWTRGDESYIGFDQPERRDHPVYDLWQIDPTGKRKPICLTGGIGRKEKIRFDLFLESPLIENAGIIVKGTDNKNLDRGFWSLKLGNERSLRRISMGPYKFGAFGYTAGTSGKFVITRETANDFPNWYITENFKNFTALTHFQPQKDFNWIKEELHQYPTKTGKLNGMMIYKPENFHENRRYPTIFCYYQVESTPEFHIYGGTTRTNADIARLASLGYVVCVPDVLNEKGKIAENTLNSVENAVKYLKLYSWFDATKIGLYGNSFGGYETNILISNSNLFTCAVSSAGVCDLVSLGGSLTFNSDNWFGVEAGQPYIGASLWENRDRYIKNSPIFQADQVNTPLLIVHGEDDRSVPFAQGVELFTALRRLKKKAWMLAYKDNGHFLDAEPSGPLWDSRIRYEQFFAHYLQGKPMPVWMSRGILTREKDIKSGLELDTVPQSNNK